MSAVDRSRVDGLLPALAGHQGNGGKQQRPEELELSLQRGKCEGPPGERPTELGHGEMRDAEGLDSGLNADSAPSGSHVSLPLEKQPGMVAPSHPERDPYIWYVEKERRRDSDGPRTYLPRSGDGATPNGRPSTHTVGMGRSYP
ncbi:hypothetical protein M8818_000766 [Zalaria obscura]|uniref:Uncharacterized protein n=1 Tax=Zalaria obscura TaxID=2024903 RepID=A0ACC3SMV7_9PEZI